jgi:hypothetical protein
MNTEPNPNQPMRCDPRGNWGKSLLAIVAVVLVLDSFIDGVVVDPATGKGQGGYTGFELLLGISRPGVLGIWELIVGLVVGVSLLPCVAGRCLRALRSSRSARRRGRE